MDGRVSHTFVICKACNDLWHPLAHPPLEVLRLQLFFVSQTANGFLALLLEVVSSKSLDRLASKKLGIDLANFVLALKWKALP